MFLILMAAAGAVASQFLTWIFASLVGFLVLPLYVCVMLLSGTGVLKALCVGFLGFAILQASYVLTGWVLEIARARSAPWRMNRAVFQPARNDRNPLRTEWPLIGGWLPLLAFYDPPCRADGSPWNGVDDPGYRTTVLAVGWFGRAFSVVVTAPKRVKAPVSTASAPQDQMMQDQTISEMDRRIAQERAKSRSTDESGPDR